MVGEIFIADKSTLDLTKTDTTNIKEDTTNIRTNTTNIKEDTAALLVLGKNIVGSDGYTYVPNMSRCNSLLNYLEISETLSTNNAVLGMVSDRNFVYVITGGSTLSNLFKLDINTLEIISKVVFSTNLKTISSDETYLYIGNAQYYVTQIRKSNLSVVNTTPSLGMQVYSIEVDDIYIYACGSGSNYIKKILKSTMAIVATSPLIDDVIVTSTSDGAYIYVGGQGGCYIRKFLKSNLTLVQTSNAFTNYITSIVCDDTYVYVGGIFTAPFKILKSDLTSAFGGAAIGGSTSISKLIVDGPYLYVLSTAYQIIRMSKYDLEDRFGGSAVTSAITIALANGNIVVGGGNYRVRKLDAQYKIIGYGRI